MEKSTVSRPFFVCEKKNKPFSKRRRYLRIKKCASLEPTHEKRTALVAKHNFNITTSVCEIEPMHFCLKAKKHTHGRKI